MSWFDTLLWPIMVAVAWIMTTFHSLFSAIGLDPAGGAAWGLSIVGLVIVIRILLIPLFVRQIKASRGMQLIQPEMQAIQKKYKGKSDPASREAMSRETMELYRRHNTNPFASCLPILLQSPIFFALFRVLNSLTALAGTDGQSYPRASIGPLTKDLAAEAESATIFGAPLSGVFLRADGHVPTIVATIVLIAAMSVTTFTTQRQLTMKNMPKAALEGPMAQQQKVLLYVMPLIFAFSGVNFPIGVLIYWTVTNLWSMGQQFYTIRRMPAPGSAAEAALKARQARRVAQHGGVVTEEQKPEIEERPKGGGQRQQPVRKDRQRPKPTGQGEGAGKTDGTEPPSGETTNDGGDDETGTPGATGGAPGQGGKPGSAPGTGANPPRKRKKKRSGPGADPAGSGTQA